MKKLVLIIALLFSMSAMAVDQHTFIYKVDYSGWVAPHSTYNLPPERLPIDLDPTHVWTGVGMCLLTGATTDLSYNPFTEQLALQGWIINVDDILNSPNQYYFNHQVMSTGDRCAYQAFTPENNVHMHHQIDAAIACKNFGDSPSYCRMSMWVHYKK